MNEENSRYTYFFGKENPLSNWHPAAFTIKGIEFGNVEQFMMYCKAMLFKDEDTARKILSNSDPKTVKALGRSVKGFDEKIWVSKREIYVEKGCLAKFSQNQDKMDFLLMTEGTFLVEASPYDRIWGVGLAANDPKINDRESWRGLNLLGQVLERVRTRLILARDAAKINLNEVEHSSSSMTFHQDKTLPNDDSIFVFGSNLAGRHGKGSAKVAYEKFGAIYSQGEGRQGQSYAIATKDGRKGTPPLADPAATLSLDKIKKGVDTFIQYAKSHPDDKFFIVRLGCDLAAWKDSDIGPMFTDAPSNCSLPENWKEFVVPRVQTKKNNIS